jgi:1-deoxy-D-xylulose-5-phosphate reductoisomerase
VVTNPAFHDRFRALLKEVDSETVLLDTENPLEEIASHELVDTVMAAIVGAAGLPSGLAAAIAGKRLLLANKESLIMSGQLFTSAARDHGADIIPIDSEHNAIFQCLAEARDVETGRTNTQFVKKIILTASGGPFLTATQDELVTVTPDQGLCTPEMVHGTKDICGFSHFDEQGAGAN